jgi:hypothetical protein
MSGKVDQDWLYECVVQIVRCPEFRNPIKDFIDDNCGSFIGVDENTFEQGALFKEFTTLIDNLLETLTQDIGITEEMFCLAAKRGLRDEKLKKYFEQLISFTNYNYFKNLMTKRNLYLEELAYKQMMKDKDDGKNKDLTDEEYKELEKKAKEMEENELKAALQMSLALEEEKQKLKALEDEELERAIKLSLIDQQAKVEKSPLIQMQPTPQKNVPNPVKEEEKKIELPKEKDTKLNPVDKVALKQKLLQEQLKEHDEKMKNVIQAKLSPLPAFNKGNEGLNKKLNEFEESKAKKLQEYREMILKMKKEKRQKEENEVDDILGGGTKKMSEEDKKRLSLRKQLAEKLKSKLSIRK